MRARELGGLARAGARALDREVSAPVDEGVRGAAPAVGVARGAETGSEDVEAAPAVALARPVGGSQPRAARQLRAVA